MKEPDILPQPETVRVDGADIAAYVIKPEHGAAAADVVLCHGTPWSAAAWLPLVRALATRYRVFLWDMPGYGASIGDGDQQHVDLLHQQRRLAALLDHWGLDRPHVLAHDIGGAVALGAHLLTSRDLASLYLLDVVVLDPWGSPFFRLVGDHEAVFAALPANLHAALVHEYIAGAGGAGLDTAWVDELARPWCSPRGQRAFYRQIAQLRPEHTRLLVARLDQVRCPVRIGWGERDPWIPRAQATELASRLPGTVEVFSFPDAGHLVPLEAADALARDVLTWLTAVTPADETFPDRSGMPTPARSSLASVTQASASRRAH
ncbi:alpha/beta fold hydrolase [Pseudactinotalea suaedae]|uniref:alpha/beta fold hydrolase n=1 Tax=Pseudactinotalea suaedae TaxID=1524924 RepID=UPI0012E32D15|nr:alpha/beta hydrolase [Pseudactinotalea suaedae]